MPSEPSHRAPRRSATLRAERLERRRRQRRRLGALTGSLAATLVIGTATLVSAVQGGSADATTAQPSGGPGIVDASLAEPARTVTAAVDEKTEAARTKAKAARTLAAAKADESVPARSGDGRRIVFSESRQRVWLVEADGKVTRTYPVSGSKYDNLDPGTYDVQSRTEQATAFDYTGTMRYFVRFTSGRNAPIGFHSVPVDNDGKLEQTKAQLGTALSSGCVRQWADDAKALWDWAPVGTKVVVTA